MYVLSMICVVVMFFYTCTSCRCGSNFCSTATLDSSETKEISTNWNDFSSSVCFDHANKKLQDYAIFEQRFVLWCKVIFHAKKYSIPKHIKRERHAKKTPKKNWFVLLLADEKRTVIYSFPLVCNLIPLVLVIMIACISEDSQSFGYDWLHFTNCSSLVVYHVSIDPYAYNGILATDLHNRQAFFFVHSVSNLFSSHHMCVMFTLRIGWLATAFFINVNCSRCIWRWP